MLESFFKHDMVFLWLVIECKIGYIFDNGKTPVETRFLEKNMQTLYADGIANIRLIDGIVRLDLVNIQNLVEDKPVVHTTGTLVMTLPALV